MLEGHTVNIGSNGSVVGIGPNPIDGGDSSGQLDRIALGALPALPIPDVVPDQTKQPLVAEVFERVIPEYAKTKTAEEQTNVISQLSETIRASARGDDVGAAEALSRMTDAKGTRLFESKEEAMRFINRTRNFGLRGLSRSELYNLRRKKNRRAIFLNTVNKTLPPEEISEKDGRYYVDKHPLPYLF